MIRSIRLPGLLLACGIACYLSVAIAQPSASLQHLDMEDGLTSLAVTYSFQDSKGFMYFGTDGRGLNRYDGIKIQSWIPRIDLPNLNYPHYGWSMVEDQSGYIWIGGGTGLFRYDPKMDSFQVFLPDDPKGSRTKITSVYLDQSDGLWVGGGDLGLLKFDIVTHQFKTSEEIFGKKTKCPSFRTVILEDNFGDLWFSGPNGLYRFSEESGLDYYPFREDKNREASDWYVLALCEDDHGNVWVGTKNELLRYERAKGTFLKIPLLKSKVTNIVKGPIGQLWITAGGSELDGLNTDGLYTIDPQTVHISQQSGQLKLHHVFEDAMVWSLYFDRSGGLWIATSKGVFSWSLHQKSFKTYVTDHDDPNIILFDGKNGNIWSASDGELQAFRFTGQEGLGLLNAQNFMLAQDKRGSIWQGSWDGLLCYRNEGGVLRKTTEQPIQWKGLAGKATTNVYVDNNGVLWIGVQLDKLYRYDEQRDGFDPFPLVFPGSTDTLKNYTADVFEDHAGHQWVTNRYGLFKLKGGRAIDFIPDIPFVNGSYVDNDGMLWLATIGGLYSLDPASHETRFWLRKDGLPHDILFSLLADDHDNLWIGTQNGLSRFDVASESFRNYDSSDGIPSNEFQPGALKTATGEFFFITSLGLLAFHPDSISDNPYAPPVVITDFRLQNKSIPIRGSLGDTLPQPSPLLEDISYTDEIHLQWDQRDVSFEFASLNYLRPEKNQYAYRLLPYNDTWTYTDAERPYASYTNLNSGRYTFEVQGSNNDGKWSDETEQLIIIISPPWFNTWWAYSLYGLAILLILWMIRRYETERQRLRHQLELENVRAEKLEEMNQIKSSFFTNISHEFRTPLTLILGPIKDLMNRANRKDLPYLELLQRNSHRLLNLINQLLDLSKIEAKEISLQASAQDFAPFLRQVFSAFSSVGKVKDIKSIYHSNVESIYLYFERNKMEKVLLNILSNAYKFTPEGGHVRLDINVVTQEEIDEHMASDGRQILGAENSDFKSMEDLDGMSVVHTNKDWIDSVPRVVLTISDSGPGIKEEYLPHIFDRFYQIDGNDHVTQEGTGIGLSLAKELILLHKGSITVESEVTVGTSFIIELPLGKDHLAPGEIVYGDDVTDLDLTMIGSLIQTQPVASPATTDTAYPLLLIVEDHADMRAYIRQHLQASYRLIEVTNGQEGLDIARAEIPDLVVSDVMMPVMDGLELCNRLKSDPRTSHIPVILLTAKAELDARIEGLEIGADAYLAKPFDQKELMVRIKKLLELRKTLHARYSSMEPIAASADLRTQGEDVFIRDLQLLIQENLDDPNFGIHQICRSLQMSRAQVYRKVKALTDISVRLYIRKFRLRKAYELLRTSTQNISEIAYDVGFKDPAYFSRMFRKEFGVSPSEVQNQQAF